MNANEIVSEILDSGRGGSRRDFLRNALGAASVPALGGIPAAAAEAQAQAPAAPAKITRKFKLGVVGCGGRGTFVTKRFQQHGGFEIYAAADYFQEDADKFGDVYGVDKSRRFSGLDGYKKLIDSGVDVVALEHMPYFMPAQAAAAIAAGKHVYMAKPVAVDVPDTMRIGELGKEATRKNLCFLVDYQAPTDPSNIEVRQRILDGALGRVAYVCTYGMAHRWHEPKADTPRPEYLRNSLWLHHVELAADACVSYDIHSIDLAMWVIGKRPVVAMGFAETRRPDAFLSGRDTVHCVMELEDGTIWVHQHQSLENYSLITTEGGLVAKIQGTSASAVLSYAGKSLIRGGAKQWVGPVDNLYPNGIVRNVAQLYLNLTEGRFDNPTVARSVDSTLTAILMREASYRRGRLTMQELLKENRKLEFDSSGFQA